MSLEKIVTEALAGRPLEMKEAFEEEIQTRIQIRLESLLDESDDTHHTVDIDHMGGHDANAKKHNITLKKTGKTPHSHDATGTKANLKKYLAKHYDDREEAEDQHPEVFKEDLQQIFESEEYHSRMADQHANHSFQHEKEATNDGHPDHDYASVAHADAEKAHNAAAAVHKKHGANSSEYKKAAEHANSATENAKSDSEGLRFRKVSKPAKIK